MTFSIKSKIIPLKTTFVIFHRIAVTLHLSNQTATLILGSTDVKGTHTISNKFEIRPGTKE